MQHRTNEPQPQGKTSAELMAEKKAAYTAVFSSENGRIVLEDLIAQGHIFDTCIVPGDPAGTHVLEGERGLVLYILAMLGKANASLTERKEQRNA